MADFPVPVFLPAVTLHPWSLESIGIKIVSQGGTNIGSAASTAYPTANQAIYVPFYLTERLTVTQLWWVNGASVSGNVDVGIYSEDGRRLISTGSTAQSGTNATQVVNITDTPLGPGLFYLALAMDNNTGTLVRGTAGSVDRLKATGCAQEASAFALPATATFATIASDYVPLFGLTTRSVF